MRTWSNSSNFLLDKRPQKITKYHFFIQIKVVNPMGRRVSIYARYSSDLQSDASIEDQVRACTEKATSENWQVVACFTDAGISGSTLIRPGIQSLLAAASNGEFDILLTEALDRLSRDQEGIAGIYKRMNFDGIKIITLSEGEISTLHVGLKGTMNALYIKDLADKTRRGLKGRIVKGKSGGGLAYGYKVVKKHTAEGDAIRGERQIDRKQAKIIRRIFHEYAYQNKSPKAIASALNKDGIPAPTAKVWGQSTINGNRRRGTGLLNNQLYIGELIWNRQRFIKDPSTGRRVPRFNPESDWLRVAVPELRIVSQELWNAAKARQKALDRKNDTLGTKKRPQYLLSGLLVCGKCSGGFSKVNYERYGCSTARNKGECVCGNRLTIKADVLEDAVLSALETHLMRDELVHVFCEEYQKSLNQLRSQQRKTISKQKAELSRLDKERANIIQAIKDGIPAELIKDDLEQISQKQEKLKKLIETESHQVRPLIHPAMALRYRKTVTELRRSLKGGQASQAKEHVRALIEKIVLTPKEGGKELSIDLYGDLAGILKLASENKLLNKSGPVNKKARKECC
jgi:site-specific DNA recombinase